MEWSPWPPPPSQTYFTVSKHIHCVCSSRRRDANTTTPHPHVHELLTLHLKDNSTICTKCVWTKSTRLTKIVDPSLESSLKILIFVPTRRFCMPCCPPPPSRKQGAFIIPSIVPSDCLTQKRESYIYLLRMVRVFVKDQHKDVFTGLLRRDKGLNNL